jgi:uncharacterized protein (AIM24 family)
LTQEESSFDALSLPETHGTPKTLPHQRRRRDLRWLHGYGNVFEKVLAPGESIDVEPGGWLYKDPSVEMTTTVARLSTGLLASMNLVLNRFTGPGRIGIQSMYLHMPSGE